MLSRTHFAVHWHNNTDYIVYVVCLSFLTVFVTMVLITCISLHSVYQRVTILYPLPPEHLDFRLDIRNGTTLRVKNNENMLGAGGVTLFKRPRWCLSNIFLFFSLFQYQQLQGVSLSLRKIK